MFELAEKGQKISCQKENPGYSDKLMAKYPGHQGPIGHFCRGCECNCPHAVPNDWLWDTTKVAMCINDGPAKKVVTE